MEPSAWRSASAGDVGPLVIWLIGAAFLSIKFPGVPHWMWIVGFIIITSILNVIGIKAAARPTCF
jgi:putrescine importer